MQYRMTGAGIFCFLGNFQKEIVVAKILLAGWVRFPDPLGWQVGEPDKVDGPHFVGVLK